MAYILDIRPRRQVTLPKEFLDKLGLKVGDSIEVKAVSKGEATIKSKKKIALDALKELQKAFQNSEFTEKEMLAELKKQRADEALHS